jgi:hypothetical protein
LVGSGGLVGGTVGGGAVGGTGVGAGVAAGAQAAMIRVRTVITVNKQNVLFLISLLQKV